MLAATDFVERLPSYWYATGRRSVAAAQLLIALLPMVCMLASGNRFLQAPRRYVLVIASTRVR